MSTTRTITPAGAETLEIVEQGVELAALIRERAERLRALGINAKEAREQSLRRPRVGDPDRLGWDRAYAAYRADGARAFASDPDAVDLALFENPLALAAAIDGRLPDAEIVDARVAAVVRWFRPFLVGLRRRRTLQLRRRYAEGFRNSGAARRWRILRGTLHRQQPDGVIAGAKRARLMYSRIFTPSARVGDRLRLTSAPVAICRCGQLFAVTGQRRTCSSRCRAALSRAPREQRVGAFLRAEQLGERVRAQLGGSRASAAMATIVQRGEAWMAPALEGLTPTQRRKLEANLVVQADDATLRRIFKDQYLIVTAEDK